MIQMETEEIEIQSVKESSSEQEMILSSQEPSETGGSSEQEIVEEPAAASAEEIKQLEECIGIIIFRSGDSDIYYFPNDETISLYIQDFENLKQIALKGGTGISEVLRPADKNVQFVLEETGQALNMDITNKVKSPYL